MSNNINLKDCGKVKTLGRLETVNSFQKGSFTAVSKWVWPRCGVSGGKRDPCDIADDGSLVHPHRIPSSAWKIEKLVPSS